MIKYITAAAALLFITNFAAAHELTPTYPKFDPSYMDNVVVAKMKMWNRREDVRYYQIDVFDEKWIPISFATQNKIVEMEYLEHKTINIYLRETDLKRAEFICSTSKLLKRDIVSSSITSKVCSRIK